ncbi:MAG TPA: hypothetical protein VGW10_17730 [Solirubrobacteraceae bacterium]|nr:hypothetical protein [Solirubrobacteraceae bacterium]
MEDDVRRILLTELIDDAGLFPPARKPMEQAVADHRAARGGPHSWMLGRFLCPASRLDELAAAGADAGRRVGAILDGDDWRADLERARAHDDVVLVEARKPLDGVAEFLEEAGPIEVFLEVLSRDPRELTAALEDLAVAGAGAKLRCGGLTPDAFPPDAAVAHFIRECIRLALPFKATAGLHHPFRARDEEIGVLQHGFVNLLAAAAFPQADAEAIVAEEDPQAFTLTATSFGWRDHLAGPDEAPAARALFTAYGSCSFAEPVDDLTAHGILEAPARA